MSGASATARQGGRARTAAGPRAGTASATEVTLSCALGPHFAGVFFGRRLRRSISSTRNHLPFYDPFIFVAILGRPLQRPRALRAFEMNGGPSMSLPTAPPVGRCVAL